MTPLDRYRTYTFIESFAKFQKSPFHKYQTMAELNYEFDDPALQEKTEAFKQELARIHKEHASTIYLDRLSTSISY